MLPRILIKKILGYISPWGKNLSSIAWEIRASYHLTIGDTTYQVVFGRDIIFNLSPVLYWQVITTKKQRQVDIDNALENSRLVTHGFEVGDIVYVEMTGIYLKIDYNEQGPYRITEVFINRAV